MNKKVLKLAPNGKRFLAYLIDAIIPIIYSVMILVGFGISISIYQNNAQMMDPFGMFGMYGFDDDFFGYGSTGGISMGLIFALLFMSLLYLVYIAVQIYFYTKAKSIGKAIMGLQVVSSKNGEPVSVWWMLLREWIVKDISGAIFFIGYIWIFIDDKKRAWHDKICDTYVVDVKGEYSEQL